MKLTTVFITCWLYAQVLNLANAAATNQFAPLDLGKPAVILDEQRKAAEAALGRQLAPLDTVKPVAFPNNQHNPALAGSTNQLATLDTVKVMELLDDHQKLGPGDRITYRVIEDQDEPRSLTVTDSGDVEVPYLGLVHAIGKTSLQLAKEIKGLLEQKLYYQATVIIAVELVNKTRVTGKVYVTGQVRNRGGFEIPAGENLTVSKAILNAGGFSDFSDKKHVRLLRKTPQGERTYIINVLNVWDKSMLDEDLLVQPDDTIVVPARLVNY